MIKEKFGQNLERVIDSGLPILLKRPIDPNLLSTAGAVVCCASALALGMGEFFIGSILLGVGGLFDLVDGVVARHFGVATPFGAFLDSTLDRLVDMVVLLALVVHYALAADTTMAYVSGVADAGRTNFGGDSKGELSLLHGKAFLFCLSDSMYGD